MATNLRRALAVCALMAAVALAADPMEELAGSGVEGPLSADPADVAAASRDFGGMNSLRPLAVLYPSSADDVARLVRAAYRSPQGFTVSARGHGHSINGQAQTGSGVVVEMSGGGGGSRPAPPRVWEEERHVDVWGGELWIDVLMATLQHGLAPMSWTDYLYLSVGGTLSNGGISGQAFNHGPQISNVHELDVVTGKGEVVTCSEDQNAELFHAVVGGLGQFGIITRARIPLQPAPQRVKWIRVLYSNISAFTGDQEHLISLHGKPAGEKFDYVEGFVIVEKGLINNWRSSIFSAAAAAVVEESDASVLYCLEISKNYDESTAGAVDQVVEGLMESLNFIPSTVFMADVPYVDFLDRVHTGELKLRSRGVWDVPHPWLNLFVPGSRLADFDRGVFRGILRNKSSGPILVYPMNRDKWDERTSAVVPEEEVFYLVALLRSAAVSGEEGKTVGRLRGENRRILEFCEEEGIGAKQYLPEYGSTAEWREHFGEKWAAFEGRKAEYDPRGILATGQRIFRPSLSPTAVAA